MRRNLFLPVALAAALFLHDGPSSVGGAEPDLPAAANHTRLRLGMTRDEVRGLLGPPRRTARQILYRRYLEQWVYDGPDAVRIEFDCVRGKEPQILTVQPLSSRRP